MPDKDVKEVPGIVMGTFVSNDGTTHYVPSYQDEKNPKTARPMLGHVFHGDCCYKGPRKMPNGQVVIIHTIIH